jgi:hypothetical protein
MALSRRVFIALVVVVSGVSSVSVAGFTTQIMTLTTYPNNGPPSADSPMNPASGTIYNHSSTHQNLSTWVAGSWASSGIMNVWYATQYAGGGGTSKATVQYDSELHSNTPVTVVFTPYQLAGTHVTVAVMVGAQNHTFTTSSTQHTFSNYGSQMMIVEYTITGMHQHPFNTTGPRVGGEMKFDQSLGDEESPVPGVGFGAILGVGLMARRRRR